MKAVQAVMTTKLNNGREVIAKPYKFADGNTHIFAKTYANHTQAARERDKHAPGEFEVVRFVNDRPFYVARTINQGEE